MDAVGGPLIYRASFCWCARMWFISFQGAVSRSAGSASPMSIWHANYQALVRNNLNRQLWTGDLEICALPSPPRDCDICLKTVAKPGVPTICPQSQPQAQGQIPSLTWAHIWVPPSAALLREYLNAVEVLVEGSRILHSHESTAEDSHAGKQQETVSSSAAGYCLSIFLPTKLLAVFL